MLWYIKSPCNALMIVYRLKNIIFFIPIIRNIQHPSAAHKEIYVFAMISKMKDIVQTSNFTIDYVTICSKYTIPSFIS